MEKRCQRFKSEADKMCLDTFILQFSEVKESELAEQLESCAIAHKFEAQEKLRLSDRQIEEVKAECAQHCDGPRFSSVEAEASPGSKRIFAAATLSCAHDRPGCKRKICGSSHPTLRGTDLG